MKECPKCKSVTDDDALFCGVCGTKFEIEEVEAPVEEPVATEDKYCIHCGKAIEADSMFCPFCGKPQEVEDEKKEEPQPKPAEPEPQQEPAEREPQQEPTEPEPQQEPEKPEPKPEETEQTQTEEQKTAAPTQTEQPEQPKPSEQPQAEETYEGEEKKKSKTLLWLLLAALIISGAAWYYLLSGSDSDPYPAVEGDYVEETADNTPDEYEEEDEMTSGALEFLEEFYKQWDYLNYESVRQHVTANVLNRLKQDYDDDCPTNDCLATWVFTAYPEGTNLKSEEGPIFSPTDREGRYKLDFKYSFNNGEKKEYETRTVYLTVTEMNGKYLISDYELVMPDVIQKPSDLSDGISGQYYLRDGRMFLHIVKDGPEIEADFNFRDGTYVSATYYFSCILDDENKFTSFVQKSNGKNSGKIEGSLDGDVLKVDARVDNQYSGSYEFKLE